MEASARRNIPALMEDLLAEAPRYDFFQAVRLAEEHSEGASRGGRLPPQIRLRPAPELVFPAGDIRRCRQDKEGRLEFQLGFLGLYGVDAPVPHDLLEAAAGDDDSAAPLRAFLDIFNARLYELLYLGCRKFRPVDRERTLFEGYLDAFGGGGEEERLYSGAFAGRVRNAEGLGGMLSEALEVPVQVRQFRPRWVRLEGGAPLGAGAEPPVLGQNAVLGERVLDISRRVEIRIGPVDEEAAGELLPGGGGAKRMFSLVRRYLPPGIDFDARLLVRSEGREAAVLGRDEVRLGWNTPLGGKTGGIREIPLPVNLTHEGG